MKKVNRILSVILISLLVLSILPFAGTDASFFTVYAETEAAGSSGSTADQNPQTDTNAASDTSVSGSSEAAENKQTSESSKASGKSKSSKKKAKSKEPKPFLGASHYKKPKGYMAEARCNERARTTGGKKGDQTGNEITLTRYRSRSYGIYGWKFVIRATDPRVANGAATFIKRLCKSSKFGYNNYKNNQSGINKRDSLYKVARKYGWDPNKIKTRVDTSCTPMCLIAFNAAGVDMSYKLKATYYDSSTGSYTGIYKARTVNAESLKAAIRLVNKKYKKQGKKAPFKIIKLTPAQYRNYKKYLKRGDVVCTGHHTAMVL